MPPNFSGVDGFFTYCLPYTSVESPPRVKVMLWQGKNADGLNATFAIVAFDVVAVTADITQKIVNHLALQFPNLGLNQGNVQVVASHTHSGPAGLTENPFWSAFACDRYSKPLWEFFQEKFTGAFQEALQNSAPIGKTSIRQGELSGLNKSRYPGMNVDSYYTGLDFWNTNSTSLQGCAAVYALHPTWYGQERRVLSGDIPGFIETEFAKRSGNPGCVFFNGAVGNADAFTTKPLPEFASQFVDAARDDTKFPSTEVASILRYAAKVVQLPTPTPNLRACSLEPIGPLVSAKILDSLPTTTKLAYFIWGKTLFVLFPGEPVFTVQESFEKAVKAKYPEFSRVQLLGLSNDYLGYVVDAARVGEKTLESCSTLYGSGIAKLLEKNLMDLLAANIQH